MWIVAALLLLGTPAVAQAPAEGAEPPPAPPGVGLPLPSQVHLVYSGGLRGVGQPPARHELHERLEDALQTAGITLDSVDVVHSVLAQGPWELWPTDGRVASALAFASGEPACEDGVRVETWRTPTERFVGAPGTPVLPVRDGHLEPRQWRTCTAGGVSAIVLGPPGQAGPPDVEPGTWDLRTGFRWRAGDHTWMQLSRPRKEPGRKLGVIRQALTAPGARFVDAGDFFDAGHGRDDGDRRAAREIALGVLQSLDAAALAIGETELALGPRRLHDDAARFGLPYVATNWRSAEGAPTFPTSVRATVQGSGPALDLVFLGVTDLGVAARVPELAAEGVTLLHPVDAVNAAVDALNVEAEAPDLIVLLGNVSPDMQRQLRSRLRGVDLFLGDPTAATYRVDRQTTTFRHIGDAFKAAPVTLPLDGIAHATFTASGTDRRIEVDPLEVHADSPSDPDLTRAAFALHARRAQALDRPLIPTEDPRAGVREERWEALVCAALLEVTDADVAFLGALPPHRGTPGPLTALQVAERLGGGHAVEVHKADGDRLASFLYAVHDSTSLHCGATTGALRTLVRGRPIDPRRTYRIATTDLSRAGTRLGELLPQSSSSLVGHLPQHRRLRADEGGLPLEDAIVAALEAADDEEDWIAAWEGLTPSTLAPQAELQVNRVSLRVERFEGPTTDAYASVPETALTSPSSFTLGGDVDLALVGSSRHVRTDLRFAAAYTRFAVDGLPPQETADQWRLSSSVALPVAAFPPKSPFRLMPFAELAFDSEFTPVGFDVGDPLPRRADLSVYGGLSAARVADLRQLRLGAFVNRDLGQLDTKDTEFGGRFSGATLHSPLPQSALWVTTAWDVQVFAPTATDDASDLRLRLWGEVRVAVRVLRSLSLGGFVQGLLVQGRVDETSAPAGTVTVGAALDLSTALRLGRKRLR